MFLFFFLLDFKKACFYPIFWPFEHMHQAVNLICFIIHYNYPVVTLSFLALCFSTIILTGVTRGLKIKKLKCPLHNIIVF